MKWKRNIIIAALIGVAALGMWRAFQPYDARADAGDGDQVFSHSILEGTVGTSEIENNSITGADLSDGLVIDGDSLCVTAGIFKFYGDTLFVSSAICGQDTLAAAGDTVQVTVPGATATDSEWMLTLTMLGTDWVGAPTVLTSWADSITFTSTGNETIAVPFKWKIEKITD